MALLWRPAGAHLILSPICSSHYFCMVSSNSSEQHVFAMDDDVEMIGDAPVVEEERKIAPEIEANRLIFAYSKEDGVAEKEAIKRSILEIIEKNSALSRGIASGHLPLRSCVAIPRRRAPLRIHLLPLFVAT